MKVNEHKLFKKDCPNYPAISTYLPMPSRIIVLGDVHGDAENTQKSLKLANVIDDDNNWIANPPDTHVVQLGDQIDRCRPNKSYDCSNPEATIEDEASDIKLLYYFTDLDEKARKQGGRVISLLGNHEIMNAQGIMDYVSYKNRIELNNTEIDGKIIKDGLEARKLYFKPGGIMAKHLACTRQSCVVIGSCVFAHAGILKELAVSLEDVNDAVRKWLLGYITHKHIKEILNSTEVSPFWPRILGQIPPGVTLEDKRCAEHVAPLLKSLQIGHIIIGHTPQFYEHQQGINSTCDSTLWRTDTGWSKAFHPFDDPKISESRRIQILEILDNGDKSLNFRVIK